MHPTNKQLPNRNLTRNPHQPPLLEKQTQRENNLQTPGPSPSGIAKLDDLAQYQGTTPQK
jgi:hypothetical protein